MSRSAGSPTSSNTAPPPYTFISKTKAGDQEADPGSLDEAIRGRRIRECHDPQDRRPHRIQPHHRIPLFQKQKLEIKKQILEASMKLFVEEGFGNVTIRRIADLIEYSPTTVYLYFKDKSWRSRSRSWKPR